MDTVLLIGATSGIGEEFARRLHALGKHLIITGRRQDCLEVLRRELKGLEIRDMDDTDFAALPNKVSEILKSFPDIDTVFLNAGTSSMFSFAGTYATHSVVLSWSSLEARRRQLLGVTKNKSLVLTYASLCAQISRPLQMNISSRRSTRTSPHR